MDFHNLRNSEWMYALENAWEGFKKSYWLNFLYLTGVLLLWCVLVLYATDDQLVPFTEFFIPTQIYVRQYIPYWLMVVGLWMFTHGWYTLLFVFRNRAIKLGQYWAAVLLGLIFLLFAYSLHFLLGMAFTIFPLRNKQYRAYLQGSSAHSLTERGSELLTTAQTERRYRRIRSREDRGVLWGGVRLPTHHAVTNFVVIGTVGSGKTLTLQLLLLSLLQLEGDSNHETKT